MVASTPALRKRTARIIAALESAHGRPAPSAPKDPLSELIFTILSQNTNDRNRDRAWASLWGRFGSWEEIERARRTSVEAAIRVGGLARTKSGVIQAVLRKVKSDNGSHDLENLRSLSMQEVESYLRTFKGIGLKTIRCVQIFSLGQPAFPVDTHIFRISKRLGLVPGNASPETAHAVMQELTPDKEVLPLHMNLIAHGRKVCKAVRPLCPECVLRRLCPYPRSRA